MKDLKIEWQKVLEDICTNSFDKNKLDNGKNVKNKDEIKNYIDTKLTYDKVKVFDDAKINGLEDTLKDTCGVNLKTLTSKNQIGTDIVEPLLAKVFGDKNNCKAVFNALEELAIITVKQDDNVKLNTKSLANIQNGTALNQIGANVSTCMNVFKTSKGKIKAVSDALKKIINESDNNKKASAHLLRHWRQS